MPRCCVECAADSRYTITNKMQIADSGGRAVQGVGLRPLACWHCGFESRRRHGCLSSVSVVKEICQEHYYPRGDVLSRS